MAVSQNWTYTDSQGISHTVELNKNKISVDGEKPVNINKYKTNESNMVESLFLLPSNGSDVVMLAVKGKVYTLLLNGKNVETGEEYQPVQIPKWIWVFYILFIVNFFVVMGGALGAVVQCLGASLCSTVAANSKMSTTAKVLACVGIYIGFTVLCLVIAVSFGLAVGLVSALN